MTDVFISYRKKTGREYARNIMQALKNRGCGNVFFDYDSLREGKFNDKIIDAIKESKNFILVLSKNALDRCVEEGDWVTKEVETAIKAGTNIIPVFVQNEFIEYPDNLPKSISEIKFKQAVTLHNDDGFEDSINRILLRFKDLNKKKRQYRWDIYISYHSSDKEFAERLRDETIRHEMNPCLIDDVSNKKVGSLYSSIIQDCISQSQKIVLIYSPELFNSLVIEEITYAKSLGKDIICIIPNRIQSLFFPSELFVLLKQSHWIMSETVYEYGLLSSGLNEGITPIINIINGEKAHIIKDTIFLDQFLCSIVSKILILFGTASYSSLLNLFQRDDSAIKWSNVHIKVLPKSFYLEIPSNKKEELTNLGFKKNDDKNGIHSLLSTPFIDAQDIHNKLLSFIKTNYSQSGIYDWIKNNMPAYINTYCDTEFTETDLLDVCCNYTADDLIKTISEKNLLLLNADMTGVYNIKESPKAFTVNLYHTDYFTYKCMNNLFHILRSVKDCFNINKNNLTRYSPFLTSFSLGGFHIYKQGYESFLLCRKHSIPSSSEKIWHLSYDECICIDKDCEKDKNNNIIVEKHDSIPINLFSTFKRATEEEYGIIVNDDDRSSGITSINLKIGDNIEVIIFSYHELSNNTELPPLGNYFEELELLPIGKLHKLEEVQATPEAKYLAKLLNRLFNSYIGNRYDVERGNNVDIGIDVNIGKYTSLGDLCKIGNSCNIGSQCNIQRNVLIEDEVVIGHRVKIENNNSIYYGIEIENDVTIGQNVCFCIEENYPTISNDDLCKKDNANLQKIYIKKGCSIHSGAIIMGGITIGENATIRAGALVTTDVPDGATVSGNPATIINQ